MRIAAFPFASFAASSTTIPPSFLLSSLHSASLLASSSYCPLLSPFPPDVVSDIKILEINEDWGSLRLSVRP